MRGDGASRGRGGDADHAPPSRGARATIGRRAMLGALAAAGVAPGLFARAAHAAADTLTMVVAAVPGGGIDRAARLAAPALEADLGRVAIFEYRPGAATRLAGDFVAKSPPDGSVLLVTTGA
jgi:tripartite-type tricarboxylate transporter receptor subunit TctC